MVEEIAPVAEPGVGDDDVDAAEEGDGAFEEGKLAVPVGGVGGVVVVVWGGDGDGWGLEVADEDVAAGGVQVGGDALPDAGGAAGYEGGFAAEFVAWGVEGGCVSS